MTQAYNLSQLANKVDTSGKLSLTTGVTGIAPIANGGTNSLDTPTDGGIAYGDGTAIKITAAGTAGQVLTSQGAGIPTWNAINTIGQLLDIRYFTSTQTYTPTSGTNSVVVEVQGGGAAGTAGGTGTSGRGGGAGGYSRERITSNFSGVTITVGGAGGTSSFGSLLSATGGSAATGGSGSSGNLNMQGGDGGGSTNISSPGGMGGGGGPYASGGGGGTATGTIGGQGGAGTAGKGYGGGGGGGGSGQNSGGAAGAGRAGIVVVYEYS